MMRMWIAAALLAATASFAHADAKRGVDFIGDAKAALPRRRVRRRGERGARVGHARRRQGRREDRQDRRGALQGHPQVHGPVPDTYFVKGRAWFDGVVPKDAPKTVVYPFGGGDLLSALVAFPDATEITTISLELAGDPRRIEKLTPDQIESSLGALRAEIGGLMSVGSNTSENLSSAAAQRSAGAGQLVPARPRRRRLRAGVDALLHARRRRRHPLPRAGRDRRRRQADAKHHDKSLKQRLEARRTSRPRSRTSRSSTARSARRRSRVHRHIGWNLGDKYLKDHPQLLRHLEKKGQGHAADKGASYLLWRGDFSQIRGYMLDHLAWMLSDSTGIPPGYAKAANMVQETYGDVRRRVPRGRAWRPLRPAVHRAVEQPAAAEAAVPVRVRRRRRRGAPRRHSSEIVAMSIAGAGGAATWSA